MLWKIHRETGVDAERDEAQHRQRDEHLPVCLRQEADDRDHDERQHLHEEKCTLATDALADWTKG